MSIGMLANMFGANEAAGPVAVKQMMVKNTNRNATINTPPAPTTDNTPIYGDNRHENELSHRFAQDGDVTDLPYKFRRALGEKIKLQTSQKSQNKIEISTKASHFSVVSGENQAQLISTGEPITPPAVLAKPVAENMNKNVRPNTGMENSAEPSQSDNVSDTLQLSAPFVQTPKPNVSQVPPAESGMTVSVTLGQVVSAMSQTENKPGQLITEQNQVNSMFGLTNASVGAFAADTDQPQGKTILDANGDGNQHSSIQLNPESVAAGGTTATNGEKPPVMDIPTVPDGPKKPLINDKLSETEPKVSVDKSNFSETGSKPSNAVVVRPINSDTEVFQQGQELSQFSGGDNKEAQHTQTNLSGHAALKNSDPAQVQISGSQAKGRENPTSDNNSDSNAGRFNWMISSDNLQPPSTGQNSFSNQEAKTSSYLYPGIGEQIRESVRTSLSQGDQQITIRLNPPELGKVFIKFQEQDGEITGILEVSKQQTRYEVEQALPEVIRNLADSGIGIKRLEVVMSNTEQSQQQENKDQSPASGQNGWFGQNSSADSDTQPKNYDTNETNQWLTNTYESTGFTESQHTFVTDESINMLV